MFLYETFYPNCCLHNVDDLVSVLEPFVFTNEKKEKWAKPSSVSVSSDPVPSSPDPVCSDLVSEVVINSKPEPTKKEPEKNNFNRTPRGVQDPLFWSIYIDIYGYNDFLRVKESQHVSNIEIQEKQKIVDFVSNIGTKGLDKLVNYKITRPFHCEIMSDLITKPRMCLSGLIAVCAFYRKNIFLVNTIKNTCLKFEYSEKEEEDDLEKDDPEKETGENSIIIYNSTRTEYCLRPDLPNNLFLLESYQKPLKAASNYKTEDLISIAQQTNFPLDKENKKWKKPELYTALCVYLLWDSKEN
jgi:hypothetical protein